MSKDDEDAEVIDFEKPPITRKRETLDECQHMQVEVDARLRRVGCVSCGELLDPIEVILSWEKYFNRLHMTRKGIEEHRRKEEARRDRQRHSRNKKLKRECDCTRCKFERMPACECGHAPAEHWENVLPYRCCMKPGCGCRGYVCSVKPAEVKGLRS